MTKVKGLHRDMYAMEAERHVWFPIWTIDDLSNVLEGLYAAVRRLLHPSVMSAEDLMAMWAEVKDVCVTSGGRVMISELVVLVRIRLEEHCSSVRRKEAGTPEDVPKLAGLGAQRSALRK